jgi:hypothetical protein
MIGPSRNDDGYEGIGIRRKKRRLWTLGDRIGTLESSTVVLSVFSAGGDFKLPAEDDAIG